MKFIITESKLENIIFKYLDNQDLIKVEKGEYIYLVNSLGDEFAQIKYNKNNGWCYIHYDLVQEISSFFSLDPFDSKEIIGKWVENTLQMRVSNTEWDRWWNHSDVVKELMELGIESIYHKLTGEKQGKELKPTLYFQRKQSRPYHIDYIFGDNKFTNRKIKLEIGQAEKWLQLSDHMPIYFEIE